jgi:quaternary ammonium compound-resistance protein SugE
MAWVYLFVAGIFEIGWPVGFKIAQNPDSRIIGIIISVLCMICSGFLLFIAQKSIPIGTAYSIWTAIGAVGTFSIGVIFYNDPASFINYCGITLIISGVILLKLAN